jgi:hypothetical protein
MAIVAVCLGKDREAYTELEEARGRVVAGESPPPCHTGVLGGR